MFKFTDQQDRAMRVFRAIDLILERALRAEPSNDECLDDDISTVRDELLSLQIANVTRAEQVLIELGVNPVEPIDGLYCYLAESFAEHCQLALDLQASLSA